MTGAMVVVGLAGALCCAAVVLAFAAAGRAAGSARAARTAALDATVACDTARGVATVALTAIGVPDVDAQLLDRRRDVSERIRSDLVAAGLTAGRINRAAADRARPTPPPSPRDDVWVKPTTN